MNTPTAPLFDRFAELLKHATELDLQSDVTLGGRLVLNSADNLKISYAPFDYIERSARLVIVGITPGAQQASNALCEAHRKLVTGSTHAEALKAAKVFASFSGPMRTNLVAMLDNIGLNRWLGVPTTAEVWDNRSDLIHFTSALRYPVFVNGKNYSGAPAMTKTPALRSLLLHCLAEEAKALPNAVWVPLGPNAGEGLAALVQNGLLSQDRVFSGMPHPSGANAERIAYFLGRKDRSKLSSKTSPNAIDAARNCLLNQITRLTTA